MITDYFKPPSEIVLNLTQSLPQRSWREKLKNSKTRTMSLKVQSHLLLYANVHSETINVIHEFDYFEF